MKFEYVVTTDMELQSNLNSGKEALLRGLEAEGLLNGTAEEISQKYALVLVGKNWLGALVEKVLRREGADGMIVRLVKLV